VKAFLFPAGQVGQLLEEGKAVVYSVGGGQLRNVTRVYQAIAASRFKPALASRVEAGNPLFARYLLEGWYSIENGNRWMARRATLELRGPEAPGQRLTLQGYLPQAILAKGPVRLTVRVDDRLFPPVVLDQPDSEFIKDFPLPDEAVGKPRLTIALELDHAIIPAGEDRELGLVFGTIAVH